MSIRADHDRLDVLIVDTHPNDAAVTLEVLKASKANVNASVVESGREALAFLRRLGKYRDMARPDLILLDLDLPSKDGRKALAEIKSDDDLKFIPVVILTTCQAEQDIRGAYSLHANCYVAKPGDRLEHAQVVHSIGDFWLTIAELPPREAPRSLGGGGRARRVTRHETLHI
jgi:chemotaxis family two-component system response regulator Rcp1